MIWKIVKLSNCQVVDFAVAELKKYMSLMDAENEYVCMSFREFEPALEDALWVGMDQHFPIPDVKDAEFDDGISINVQGKSGYIAGTNSRSVLIAVYRFLKELGCAFIRPGREGEVIPKRSLKSVSVSVFEAASYRHRGVCIEGAVSADHVLRNIDWLPKVGMNAFFNQFQVPYTFYDRWYSHKNNPLWKKESISLKDAEGIRNASMDEIKRRGLLYHATGHGWTCEPFGIEGTGWDVKEYNVPDETKPYLALVNGKRELWNGIPLNTNLCYSSEYVKDVMARSVMEYCRRYPQVDVLHVWLADDANNHCECERCKNRRPADLYVELLNRIDQVLTENHIDTKIVFLIYFDLLWEPKEARLNNPDRFILMFAPITRTYSESLADAKAFDESKLMPYVKNNISFPKNVSENLQRLFRWQKHFDGDSFLFDYHYMWDHFLDPGYYKMAQILFKDMKYLDKYGIGGMISCQNQRVFFPTSLGMVAMAEVLWNKEIAFEDVAQKYFRDAFGVAGDSVREYLSTLSLLFDPPYLRGERQVVNEQSAENYAKVAEVVDGFARQIHSQLETAENRLEWAVEKSWEYLLPHGELCKRLSKAFTYMAKGLPNEAKEAMQEAIDYAKQREAELHNVFDVCLFCDTFERTMKYLIDPTAKKL